MPNVPPLYLSVALRRQLARSPLKRPNLFPSSLRPLPNLSFARPLSSSSTRRDEDGTEKKGLSAKKTRDVYVERYPKSALAALLSRLALDPDPSLYPAVMTCLTHRSYGIEPVEKPRPQYDDFGDLIVYDDPPEAQASSSKTPTSPVNGNELHAELGNSLLGVFAAEHLAHRYSLLPTEALKLAVTAFVGPDACFAVAREIGIGVTAEHPRDPTKRLRHALPSIGLPVRWSREGVSVRRGGNRGISKGPEEDDLSEHELEDRIAQGSKTEQRESFTDVVASSIRAFVGLIFQERGIHAARTFVHAHFLSRHLDLPSLFNFTNPKYILSSVVARHLAESGVSASAGAGRIQSRLLASSGTTSHSPLFNVGLFLPSGLKLAEGHGSSKAMAEHRAAINALLSLYLVRGDQTDLLDHSHPSSASSPSLPTSAHPALPFDDQGLVMEEGKEFIGDGFGGLESNVGSSTRAYRGGRVSAAQRTNAL